MTRPSRYHSIAAAVLGLAIATVALPALADPYDYRDHRDTISSSAGNASAANIAVQTIDPWPPYAKRTTNHLDGRRAGVAISRYQLNKSLEPRGLATTTVYEQAGPGAQSSTAVTK
jgi:hypothetical protein